VGSFDGRRCAAVTALIVRRLGAPLYEIERLHVYTLAAVMTERNEYPTRLCARAMIHIFHLGDMLASPVSGKYMSMHGDTDGAHVFTGIHRVVT
jgi:hypothetical protein